MNEIHLNSFKEYLTFYELGYYILYLIIKLNPYYLLVKKILNLIITKCSITFNIFIIPMAILYPQKKHKNHPTSFDSDVTKSSLYHLAA